MSLLKVTTTLVGAEERTLPGAMLRAVTCSGGVVKVNVAVKSPPAVPLPDGNAALGSPSSGFPLISRMPLAIGAPEVTQVGAFTAGVVDPNIPLYPLSVLS